MEGDHHSELFNALKKEASSRPPLLATAPSDEQRFYFLRTDWSCLGRGPMLAQPNDHPSAIEEMDREIEGGQCEFDARLNEASK
jgi:hypothetical protein